MCYAPSQASGGRAWAETVACRLSSHAPVLRIEQRRVPDDGDGDPVALAEILDGKIRSDLRVLRRQIAHQDGLADRRARTGAGDVGPAAVLVLERRPIWGQDRLAALHVAFEAGLRGVIVHRERAEERGGLLGALPQIRLFADEVLRLD